MPDPNIVFWAGIPDGSKLTATAKKQAGSAGTFAIAGYLHDEASNHQKVTKVPFVANLATNHTYQLVLELLPVGGAVVDVEVKIESGGSVIRKTAWAPVQGSAGLRGVFVRTERD